MSLTARSLAPGEGTYRAGEANGALYILTGGVVRLSTAYAGHGHSREATLKLIGPWEIFGYPVFCRSVREISAEAFTTCEVIKVPRVFLERTMRGREEARHALVALIELTLAEREDMLACLLPRGTEARLARLLPILLGKFGEDGLDGWRTVGSHLTRMDLAAMVASTRESVNSAVIRLCDRGIITIQRGRIAVLDSEALAGVGNG